MGEKNRPAAPKTRRPIRKSHGTTRTENLLSGLCDCAFLQLWSYANPHKDDGHELCDLLAVFDKHVFVFFDREKAFPDETTPHTRISWERWKREAIERQVRTLGGAVKYIKSGREIFLDPRRQRPLPLSFDRSTSNYYKILVAHGVEAAIQGASDENVTGSLAVSYGAPSDDIDLPFVVNLDKDDPVHVLDSSTLPVILGELDTIFDLSNYFAAKEEAVRSLQGVFYCGEEDLLAHYFMNFDEDSNRHFIGVEDESPTHLMIAEGWWRDFEQSVVYQKTKLANEVSYLWDELIQKTCAHSLGGTLLGNCDGFDRSSPISEMAREPRFSRRALSRTMSNAIGDFPSDADSIWRWVSFMPSYYSDQGYVFLQLWVPFRIRGHEYRGKRRRILEIACGAAKVKWPHLTKVIGIAMDAPKHAIENSEDFLAMDCRDWSEAEYAEYRHLNRDFEFFEKPQMHITERSVSEFVNE